MPNAHAPRLSRFGLAGRDDVTAGVDAERRRTTLAQDVRRALHGPALHHRARVEAASRYLCRERAARRLLVPVAQREHLDQVRGELLPGELTPVQPGHLAV